MDDVQNTLAPLYGKAEPATAKTTMSVREMQHLLGLGKTDSYWLLHKNFFEVILINDKMRIVISSFEKWYANQVKYHKVNGPPPGEELCKRSYSVLEVAEILKVDSDTVYTLVRQGKLKAETVDFWMRIPKEEFERWYRSQSRHRTAADWERDRKIEAQTISIPEMAKLLGIPREKVYWILDCKNTETVSLLSAWPTGGALPKQVLKYGSTANLHIDSKNRSWKRMKSHRWN